MTNRKLRVLATEGYEKFVNLCYRFGLNYGLETDRHHANGVIMKFDFDPQKVPGVVKMVGVMRALAEAKVAPSISTICAASRELLTPDELTQLPQAPETPSEGNVSTDPLIAWSAFLLWAALRGEL